MQSCCTKLGGFYAQRSNFGVTIFTNWPHGDGDSPQCVEIVFFCFQFLQEYTQSHNKTSTFHIRLVTLSPHYDIMAWKISFLANCFQWKMTTVVSFWLYFSIVLRENEPEILAILFFRRKTNSSQLSESSKRFSK